MSDYRRPVDAASLAHNFRVFGEADCPGEPLYATLSRAIASDPAVLDLLMHAPYPQRRSVLLFAATHDLLLAGSVHPLARFYRSLDPEPRVDVDEAPALFADFCNLHRSPLLALLGERTVQTNEVGRSAGLRLALSALAARDPIALIDVGCSAGLNLLVDRYRCEYALPDGTAVSTGPRSEVIVRATIVDDLPLEAAWTTMPSIASRIGIDLAPLDVHDDRDARWLQACVWPSDVERHIRLAAALAIARRESLDLRRGDADEQLAGALLTIGEGARPVVFHSWVVSYFDHAAKRRFVDAMRAMVVDRDGAWISAEGPDVVPGLAAPALPVAASPSVREATVWHLTTREGDRAVSRAIARSHPHGRWIERLAAGRR